MHWSREDLSKELRSADSGLIKEDGTMDLRKPLVSSTRGDFGWPNWAPCKLLLLFNGNESGTKAWSMCWTSACLNSSKFKGMCIAQYTSYIIMLENPRREKHNMALRSSFTQNTNELPPGGFEWQSSLPWHDWHQVGSPPVATNSFPLAVWNPGTHFGMSHWSIHPSHRSQCAELWQSKLMDRYQCLYLNLPITWVNKCPHWTSPNH